MERAFSKLDIEDMLESLGRSAIFEGVPPEREVEARRLVAELLASALLRLTAEERVFLKMRYVHGCTVNEIARAFHEDADEFRRRFNRILAKTRKLVTSLPRQLEP